VPTDLLRIGTRGSELALWQAHWVQSELRRIHPALTVTITIIKTTGDKVLDAPLSAIGDKGLFTREIEHALLAGEVDIAVHSLKDLPTQLPAGLMLGVICDREDVRDVFIPHPGNPVRTLMDQPPGARIATGSLRRKCQLLHLRPDLSIIDIRGNLNTRMKKLEASNWAGMLLARAGVVRLGWQDRIGESLDPLTILPAVGQGALGIEIRTQDPVVAALLAPLHHPGTAAAALAERALLRRLEGGCQVPIGTFGRLDRTAGGEERLALDAIVGSLDGRTVVRGRKHGLPGQPEVLGRELAEELIAQGAGVILDEIRSGKARTASGAAM
jgi:hydroxymethylbilane synthase